MKFVTPPEKPHPNILLFGPPKTGKTIGACTAPGGLLLFNNDLRNATRQAHRRNPEGRILEPEMPEPNEEGNLNVMALMSEIAREVANPDSIIDSIVVDPVGELYRRLIEDQARRAIRPTLSAYGDVGVHVERFCRFLCNLPHLTTVLVCHELAQKDDAAGEFQRIPFTGTKAGSETLGQKLMGMVDIVAYTGVKELEDGTTEYLAQMVPLKGRQGGDRFACLGDYRPINIAEWIACIDHYETTGVSLPYPSNDVSTSKLAGEADTLSETAPAEAAAA